MLKNNSYFILLYGAGLVLIPFILLAIPSDWLNDQQSVCLFKNITGHECYGCGMTRAVVSLVHFRLDDALFYNKLVIAVFPLLCFIWGKTLLSLLPSSIKNILGERIRKILSLIKQT